MTVTPYDRLHRFMVTSEGTDPNMSGREYLVDLAANDGAGQCACKNWQCRVWPLIRDGWRPTTPEDLWCGRTLCKHVAAARRFQYGEFFLRLITEPHSTTATHE